MPEYIDDLSDNYESVADPLDSEEVANIVTEITEERAGSVTTANTSTTGGTSNVAAYRVVKEASSYHIIDTSGTILITFADERQAQDLARTMSGEEEIK